MKKKDVLAFKSRLLKKKAAGSLVKKQNDECHGNSLGSTSSILQKRSLKKFFCHDSSVDQNDCLITECHKVRKRRKKKEGEEEKNDLDEPLRLQRRVRYLLVRLKLEQNLIDAYRAEGWNRQSREKIRPEKELQRAEEQILKCKLGIRDAVHQLDLMSSEGQIDDSLIAPDGSVHHEHIFCTKCRSREASEDNDIILCDGSCNCAFHQKCLDPPLATEDIPPENEGWLCKYCDCKMEIMDTVNAHLGSQFSVNNTWKDVFEDEAALLDAGTKVEIPEEEWPGDDSDDNDYEPGCSEATSEEKFSVSEESSLCCTTENDNLSDSECCAGEKKISCSDCVTGLKFGTDPNPPNNHDVVCGPRRRFAVDYQQLYGEMFGKDATCAEYLTDDEEWGPPRKRRKSECDAASTLMTLCESENKVSDFESVEAEKENSSCARHRKPFSRMPLDALEKLHRVFMEDELPTRAVKQNLSEQLGLDFDKVDKWFKNARYGALKSRKDSGVKCLHPLSPEVPDEQHPEAAEHKDANSRGGVSSLAASIEELKQPKKYRWRKDLIYSKMLSQKQKDRNALDGSSKRCCGSTELKARTKRKRILSTEARHRVEAAEVQMEQLYQIERKIQMLKFILTTLATNELDKSNELCPAQVHVVYVPTAELKEKLQSQ